MGCGNSKVNFVVNNDIEGQGQSSLEVFMSIGLNLKDINKLFNAFKEIDADGSGSIRAVELFTYFNLELSGFEKSVFGVFDEDKSGVLNFMEFVCSMWNLLTLSDADLGVLAYLIKDPTGALRIRYADVRDLIEIFHKKKIDGSPALNNLYVNLKKTCPSEISLVEFCKWTAANPTVMSPLLILQLKLRKLLIGESYWARMAVSRKENLELGSFGFIKQLQTLVRKRNDEFKNKRIDEEAKRLREKRLGPGGDGQSRSMVARKESVLLGAFNLKQLSSSKSVSPTPPGKQEDKDTGAAVSSKEVRQKPSPSNNGSSSKLARDSLTMSTKASGRDSNAGESTKSSKAARSQKGDQSRKTAVRH